MIHSAISLAARPENIEFVAYCDEDDYTMKDFYSPQVNLIIGPRLTVSKMTNICFESSSGDIIMYAADDIIFKTKSWDLIVIENLTKKACLCFGNDLGQKKLSIATHGFVTREFALINKSLLPELFAANFCDTWVTSIARMARCSNFLPHLIIEHMHPAWGKSDQDDTYAARNSSRTFLKLWLKFRVTLPRRVILAIKIIIYNFASRSS